MFEGNSCQIISDHRSNVSNHYYCDLVLAKRIHDLFQCYALIQKRLTSDWRWPASSFSPSYCTWIVKRVCVPIYRSVPIYFSADFNFAVKFFYICLYITSYQRKRQVMNSNKVIYSVLKFIVVCHVIVLLLASVNGSILSEVLKDIELQGHQLYIMYLKLWTITRSA